MDLNSVRLFVAAAHAGSLSEAARQTRVPLPTLSRRVRGLEDELGVRLIERHAKGLSLTDAGARLLSEAEPAIALLSQAGQRLLDPSGIAGTLRVSLPPHFEPMWAIFDAFRRRHAAVSFDVFVTDRRIDLVSDGVDVAIRVGEGGHGSYQGRTVARYRHRLVASPGLVERHAVRTPADLTDLACACWRSDSPPSWLLGGTELPLRPVVATNDYRHLLHLAVTGRAVTELPPFLARDPIERGELVELLRDHPLPDQAVRALVPDTRLLAPLIRQFLDFVVEATPRALEHAAG